MSRAVHASRDKSPRAGPFSLGAGLGPPVDVDWTPGGRATLVAGSAVAADTTGATKLYYTEHEHSMLPLWNGKRFVREELPLSSATGSREAELSLANVANATVYDFFGVKSSRGPALVLGPAWTSATARAASGALARVGGRRVLANDPKMLWLGTLYGSGAGTVDDSGAACQRYLWNTFNRVPRKFLAKQASSWTYTSATIRAANGTTGQTNGNARCSFVLGASEDLVDAWNIGYGFNSGGAVQALAGVGLDSTTANHASAYAGALLGGGAADIIAGRYLDLVAIGFHYLQAVEACSPSGTSTWHGASSPYIQAALIGSVWA